MFKYILTFLGINVRDASLMTLYFVVLGISILKIRSIGLHITLKFVVKKLKINMIKMTFGPILIIEKLRF